MTNIVMEKGIFSSLPESGYPKYSGYHPNFRGISEPVR